MPEPCRQEDAKSRGGSSALRKSGRSRLSRRSYAVGVYNTHRMSETSFLAKGLALLGRWFHLSPIASPPKPQTAPIATSGLQSIASRRVPPSNGAGTPFQEGDVQPVPPGELSCNALRQLRSVFIVALGRSGSSQLLRVLNSIPGYRISGETDNAWIHLARFARGVGSGDAAAWRKQTRLPICETWPAYGERVSVRAARAKAGCRHRVGRRHREAAAIARSIARSPACRDAQRWSLAAENCQRPETRALCASSSKVRLECPLACNTCWLARHMPLTLDNGGACQLRRLLLALHNPAPHARVFGFKEIYSPFVRHSSDELFHNGVSFLRYLFPHAKFIFHWRANSSRIAISDFWRREPSGTSVYRFEHAIAQYQKYVRTNPDHAFATTLEGITSKGLVDFKNARAKQQGLVGNQLQELFHFLEEPLTPEIAAIAHEHLNLLDWSEEVHTRRVPVTLPNGTVVYQHRSYAFATAKTRDKSRTKV